MTTRHIVPRADGEGGLGREAKKWGEVWADFINGFLVSQTPGAETIPAANTDGKLSLAWLPTDTAPKPGTIPVADGTGKLDSGWLPASAGGGGASDTTILQSAEIMHTTESSYETLYTGTFLHIPRSFVSSLALYVDRAVSDGATGRIRASVTDGTTNVTVEGPAYTVGAIDKITLDCASLDSTKPWTITLDARTAGAGTVTISRVKLQASPSDPLSAPPVLCGEPCTISGPTWASAGGGTIATGTPLDGAGRILLYGAATLTGSSGNADIKLTVSGRTQTVSEIETIATDGLFFVSAAIPDEGASRVSVSVRTTEGTVCTISAWQVHIDA
jgi:hypothetical protein